MVSHESRLRQQIKADSKASSKSRKTRKKDALDQNTFDFMDEKNQRGIFDDSSRNLYEGEDLDVPAYLRRGVKIAV